MGMLHKVDELWKKNSFFYDDLKYEWDIYGVGDFVMYLYD